MNISNNSHHNKSKGSFIYEKYAAIEDQTEDKLLLTNLNTINPQNKKRMYDST